MEKTEKKLWIIGCASFVAGVATTLTVLSLWCCPPHYGHKPFHHFHPQAVEMTAHKGGDMAQIRHHHHRHHLDFAAHHPEPTSEMKAKFAERLGLTDEQKEKLEQMRQEDMAKMAPLFEQMKTLRQQMRDLRKTNRAHFESVLTDAQKEILQKMKAEHQKP